MTIVRLSTKLLNENNTDNTTDAQSYIIGFASRLYEEIEESLQFSTVKTDFLTVLKTQTNFFKKAAILFKIVKHKNKLKEIEHKLRNAGEEWSSFIEVANRLAFMFEDVKTLVRPPLDLDSALRLNKDYLLCLPDVLKKKQTSSKKEIEKMIKIFLLKENVNFKHKIENGFLYLENDFFRFKLLLWGEITDPTWKIVDFDKFIIEDEIENDRKVEAAVIKKENDDEIIKNEDVEIEEKKDLNTELNEHNITIDEEGSCNVKTDLNNKNELLLNKKIDAGERFKKIDTINNKNKYLEILPTKIDELSLFCKIYETDYKTRKIHKIFNENLTVKGTMRDFYVDFIGRLNFKIRNNSIIANYVYDGMTVQLKNVVKEYEHKITEIIQKIDRRAYFSLESKIKIGNNVFKSINEMNEFLFKENYEVNFYGILESAFDRKLNKITRNYEKYGFSRKNLFVQRGSSFTCYCLEKEDFSNSKIIVSVFVGKIENGEFYIVELNFADEKKITENPKSKIDDVKNNSNNENIYEDKKVENDNLNMQQDLVYYESDSLGDSCVILNKGILKSKGICLKAGIKEKKMISVNAFRDFVAKNAEFIVESYDLFYIYSNIELGDVLRYEMGNRVLKIEPKNGIECVKNRIQFEKTLKEMEEDFDIFRENERYRISCADFFFYLYYENGTKIESDNYSLSNCNFYTFHKFIRPFYQIFMQRLHPNFITNSFLIYNFYFTNLQVVLKYKDRDSFLVLRNKIINLKDLQVYSKRYFICESKNENFTQILRFLYFENKYYWLKGMIKEDKYKFTYDENGFNAVELRSGESNKNVFDWFYSESWKWDF